MLEEVPAQSLFLAVNPLLLCVLGTDEVKQKTSLFSVQGKICLELFHGFCSFFLHHLCMVPFTFYMNL